MQGTSVDDKETKGHEDKTTKAHENKRARGQGQHITRGQEQRRTLKQRTAERENKGSKNECMRTRGQATREQSQVWGALAPRTFPRREQDKQQKQEEDDKYTNTAK